MKKLFIFITLFFFISCNTEKQNVEHLIIKNKQAFKPDSDKPYTGQVFKLNKKGKKAFEGYLKDGKPNGEFIFYDENEAIEKKENYKNGEKDGEFVEYFKDGKLRHIKHYKEGKEDGKFENYKNNGNKIYEGYYSDGLEIDKHTYWFTDGSQIQVEFEYDNGTIKIETVKEYYQDGKIKTTFDRLSKNNYKMKEYFANGKIKHEVNFLYDSYEGEKDKSSFYIHLVGSQSESTVAFDLGKSVNEFFGEEMVYDENGRVVNKTIFFYPNQGVISRKYYNGNSSIYDNVTSYTEHYNDQGLIIKKCADTKSGSLSCVEGDELGAMVLLDAAENVD